MNRNSFWVVFCASMSLAQGTPAFAEGPAETLDASLAPSSPGGLTSDQVAVRARETSYDAAARRQALVFAEAQLNQALVAYYPRLVVSASYTRLSPITQPVISFPTGAGMASSNLVFPVFLDNYLVQAGLTIPLSDYVLRLSQNYAAASRSKRAALLDEQAARLKAATDSRETYYAWLRAKGQLVVAQRAVEQAKGHLDDAHNSFDVGTASKADVLRVESQLASGELVLAQTRSIVELTEEQLRTAMHDPSPAPYAIGEDLRQDLPPLAMSENIETLRAEAMSRRLEIRALDETAWSFREQAASARAAYYPKLDAFGDVLVANPNSRVIPAVNSFSPTWDVGIRLTWVANDVVGAGNQTSQNVAHAEQTEMQKRALADSVRIEVLQAYLALRDAEVADQTSKRGLAAAEEGYRVRRELFKNGRATSVELTDAEVELSRAGLEAINARADLRWARARLVHATGRDIPAAFLAR